MSQSSSSLQSSLPQVMGKEGLLGRLETPLATTAASQGKAVIRLEDGRQLHVPAEVLKAQADGSYFLPISPLEIEQALGLDAKAEEKPITIPVIAEELQVHKNVVETGRVQIRKTVQEHEQTVDEPLLRETVTVERVTLNRPWEGPAPEMRQEGETLIIPVLEEVLVTEKRLMLKEELHIRREQSTFHEPQRVILRSEEVSVERLAVPQMSEGRIADPS